MTQPTITRTWTVTAAYSETAARLMLAVFLGAAFMSELDVRNRTKSDQKAGIVCSLDCASTKVPLDRP